MEVILYRYRIPAEEHAHLCDKPTKFWTIVCMRHIIHVPINEINDRNSKCRGVSGPFGISQKTIYFRRASGVTSPHDEGMEETRVDAWNSREWIIEAVK
jgi:hypothetical protein